jgi:hypothetical protein
MNMPGWEIANGVKSIPIVPQAVGILILKNDYACPF